MISKLKFQKLDNRFSHNSYYEKGFTAKILIGITPAGFIGFKSKASGGRTSSTEITIESGLLDLLEEEDVILADDRFSVIQENIDAKKKKAYIVVPPFLVNKTVNIKQEIEETEETQALSKVRIHVERTMQQIRNYQILNTISESLFPYIDDIIHMCCVLVNLQLPISSVYLNFVQK